MRDLKVEAKQADNGIELQLVGELIFSDTKQFMTDIPIRVRDKGPCVILNLEAKIHRFSGAWVYPVCF